MKNKFNPGDLVELTYNGKRLALVLSYSHEIIDSELDRGRTKIYVVYVFDNKLRSLYKEWSMRKIS